MCGLTLPFPQSVSCSVIQDPVLGTQAVHLQKELILGGVSADGDLAFQRAGIVCATTITINDCVSLLLLLWSLGEPGHITATEGELRGPRGESQRPPKLH